MIRVGLDGNGTGLRQRRRLHVLRARRQVAQDAERPIDRLGDLRVEVVVERRAGHAQAQRRRAAPERARVVGHVRADARDAPRIVPGQRLQHERGIGHRPTHRAHVIERHAERDNAADARQPVGRFQTDDAAVGGRNTHRSPGIGPQRAGAQSRGDRRTGSAGRPAGMRSTSHGLRTGPVCVNADVRRSELVHVELAQDDGAGLIEPRHHLGVLIRDAVRVHGARGGRQHARRVDVVLQRDRMPCNGRATAPGDLRPECPRARHGTLEVRLCIYTNYCEALDQRHRQVTCELWDRENLKEKEIKLSRDGKRRLVAPRWRE